MTPRPEVIEGLIGRLEGAGVGREPRDLIVRMATTGAPIVVSAKIKKRPETWRDHRGAVRHAGYPSLTGHLGAFRFTVAGDPVSGRAVRSLLNRLWLDCYRSGWLVRTRYRLRDTPALRALLSASRTEGVT